MQVTTAAIMRDTAGELEGSLETLVDDVSRHIAGVVPEVLDGDSYRASNRANLRLKLAVLRRGSDLAVPDAPYDAVMYARDLARQGADLSVLLRAYDLGHQLFWSEWTTRCAARTTDPAVLAELYDVSARFLFAYFEAVPATVTSAYRAELERRGGDDAEARRTELVCQLLGAVPGDVSAAGRELGYRLLDAHHLALVHAPAAEGDVVAARSAIARIGRELGVATLIVQAETQRLWAWVQLPGTGAAGEVEERLVALDGLGPGTLAIGDAGAGLEGFCDSHREAEHALRQAGGRRRGGARLVVRHRDIGAASLLASDARRARRFAERELGELAAADDATARTRATVQVFLQENCNQARTARRLGIHYNTVAYRLRQAEELLGRPVTERRFDLEAALLLHARRPQ